MLDIFIHKSTFPKIAMYWKIFRNFHDFWDTSFVFLKNYLTTCSMAEYDSFYIPAYLCTNGQVNVLIFLP